jgi:hypothetical protein
MALMTSAGTSSTRALARVMRDLATDRELVAAFARVTAAATSR